VASPENNQRKSNQSNRIVNQSNRIGNQSINESIESDRESIESIKPGGTVAQQHAKPEHRALWATRCKYILQFSGCSKYHHPNLGHRLTIWYVTGVWTVITAVVSKETKLLIAKVWHPWNFSGVESFVVGG
jgi:hypothetical protein